MRSGPYGLTALNTKAMTDSTTKKAACALGIIAAACAFSLPATAVLTPNDALNKEVITNPAGGTHITGLYRSGVSAYYYFGSGESMTIDGEEGQLVTDGNDIYILNPVLGGTTNTWVKGEIAPDGTVTVATPQLISGGAAEGFAYYLMNGLFDEDNNEACVNDVESRLRYRYIDGKLSLAEGCPSIFEYTVPCDINGNPIEGEPEQWVWSGYMSFSDEFRPHATMGESAPATLKATEYVMYSDSEGVQEGRPVKAGIEGDSFWIQGLEVNVPQAWVKGEITGDKVTFTPQFICLDEKQHLFQFLLPARTVMEDGVTVGYDIAENVVMDYDREHGTLKAPKGQTLFVNAGVTSIYALSRYESPELRPDAPLSGYVPANPVILTYTPYSEEWQSGGLDVALPQVNTFGEYLNPEEMYYMLMEKDEPVEISSDRFPDTEEPMWEIPYYYAGGAIFASGTVHSITFSAPIEDLGVKLIYYDNKGAAYESDIVRVNGEGGVSELGEREIREIYYTDMTGLRVSGTTPGLLIRTVVYTDGTRKTTKTAVH